MPDRLKCPDNIASILMTGNVIARNKRRIFTIKVILLFSDPSKDSPVRLISCQKDHCAFVALHLHNCRGLLYYRYSDFWPCFHIVPLLPFQFLLDCIIQCHNTEYVGNQEQGLLFLITPAGTCHCHMGRK